MLTMAEAKSAETAERAIRLDADMRAAIDALAHEVAWQGGFSEEFAAEHLWQWCGELLADYCEPDEDDDDWEPEPEGRTALAVGAVA